MKATRPVPFRSIAVGLVFVVYGVAFVASQGLRFELVKDEVHFWETTEEFFLGPFPPSAETLRSYPEVITPLSFMIWGQLHGITGDGITAGRALNFVLSIAIVLLLVGRRREDLAEETQAPPGVLGATGFLLCPYSLVLSVHLYSDLMGLFFLVVAFHLQLNGRLWAAMLVWGIALSTRQYLVEIPAALAASEGLRSLLGHGRWRETATAILGCTTLLAWIAFWGGLANPAGLERWISPYPAPMLEPLAFILAYGLYFLVGIAVYFVIPEMLLFRCTPSPALVRQPWVWVTVALLAVAFAIDLPLLSDDQPGGIFGRAARLLLPGAVGEALRVLLFYALALLALLRFLPARDLAFWIVTVSFVLAMKSQIPWEKYLLTCILPLWYLRSRPWLDGGIATAWQDLGFRGCPPGLAADPVSVVARDS